MRVFGIDPGSRYVGFGVVEDAPRGAARCLAHGVIKATLDAPLELRLREIFEGLSAMIALHTPQAVAVEGLFSFRNARSALVLGHARGIALLVAAQAALPVFEYAPAQVKRSVGAGGAAGKDAVARMVKRLLSLETQQRADATDALAVALCHLHQRRSAIPAASSRGRARTAFAARLAPAYQRLGTQP